MSLWKVIRHKGVRLRPAHILVLGFFGLIVMGTLLLMIPAATSDRHHLSFIDALFQATSAVCVTGLSVVDVSVTFTLLGQLILLALIQLGGWGFLTCAILIFLALGKRIGFKQRLLLQDSLNYFSVEGVVKLVLRIIGTTVTIEVIGAIVLAIRWSQEMSIGKAAYYGIFHSISAFNNAGFSLAPNNLMGWVGDPTINLTITSLFILGGIGFFVIIDVIGKHSVRKLSLHTRITILFTLILNVASTILLFVLEYGNPGTLGGLSLGDKWWAAYFQGVVTRTAGFNTIDIGAMTPSSQVLMMGLMFIGAGSGSTAGGIKVTTFALLIFTLWMVLTNRDEIILFNRKIPGKLVFRALAITVSGALFIFVIFFLLTITEKGADIIRILFETVSAFGTVGLSANFTPELSKAGRLLITLMMFIGRLGPLTMAFALAIHGNKKKKIGYPEEKIMIG